MTMVFLLAFHCFVIYTQEWVCVLKTFTAAKTWGRVLVTFFTRPNPNFGVTGNKGAFWWRLSSIIYRLGVCHSQSTWQVMSLRYRPKIIQDPIYLYSMALLSLKLDQIFFCDPVALESICYRTRAKRLINESNTTGGRKKIWTGRSVFGPYLKKIFQKWECQKNVATRRRPTTTSLIITWPLVAPMYVCKFALA